MRSLKQSLRTGFIGLMLLCAGAAHALDAGTVASIVTQVGKAIYGPLLAPKVVFDNILCGACDMSTEHVVG